MIRAISASSEISDISKRTSQNTGYSIQHTDYSIRPGFVEKFGFDYYYYYYYYCYLRSFANTGGPRYVSPAV